MKFGIVIGSGEGREEMLDNCLYSMADEIIDEPFPWEIKVIKRNDFELGVIKEVMDKTDFDEFIFLHDTCEIKSAKLFDFCFIEHRGESVSFSTHPSPIGMYLGKYRREILNKMVISVPKDKLDAVEQEITFPMAYNQLDKLVNIPYPLRISENFVTMFGRVNMKLENDWLIKYKANWNRGML